MISQPSKSAWLGPHSVKSDMSLVKRDCDTGCLNTRLISDHYFLRDRDFSNISESSDMSFLRACATKHIEELRDAEKHPDDFSCSYNKA